METVPTTNSVSLSLTIFPDSEFEPDLLLRVYSADRAQTIVQRHVAQTGERTDSPISGIGAACGECTAHVLTENVPAVSLGCNGSRPGIGLGRGELLVAAPAGHNAGSGRSHNPR